MKAIGLMIKLMAEVYIFIPMGPAMKANGITIINTEKVKKPGRTEQNMSVITRMVKNRIMANFTGQIILVIREISRKMLLKERERIYGVMVESI